MIFGVILISKGKEEAVICQQLRELTAHRTEEKLEIKEFQKSSSLQVELKGIDLLDIAVIDVTLPGALESARTVRDKFENVEILVVADVSVSPMKYMHPSIRASALLLKPMTRGWNGAINDFYGQMLSKSSREKPGEVLWIENRDGIFRIPYEQIYYLEAREKKVFVRTRMEEFGTSGTIEKFASQLPADFIRCHRSFIVNTSYISKIKLSENLLYLRENLFVPISRSYKNEFKRRSYE